jgi:hypothetical protein
MNYRRKKIFY